MSVSSKMDSFMGKVFFNGKMAVFLEAPMLTGKEKATDNSTILSYQVYPKECGPREF